MFSQSEGKKFNNCTPLFKYIYLPTQILLFLVENSFFRRKHEKEGEKLRSQSKDYHLKFQDFRLSYYSR